MTTADNKAALLALFKPKTLDVTLPDGGVVTIRELSAEKFAEVRAKVKLEKETAAATAAALKASGSTELPAADDGTAFGHELLILSVLLSDGSPAFTTADLPDIRAAGNGTVEILVGKVLELNGFKKAPAEKNLPATPSGGSATASPSLSEST